MSNLVKCKLRLKRRVRSALTTRWVEGEPIVTIDTGELFIGMGETVDALKISDFIQVDVLPLIGIKNKIYILRSTKQSYYWTGIKYEIISGQGGVQSVATYSALPSVGIQDIIYIVKTDEKFYPTTETSLYVWDTVNLKYILSSRSNPTNSFSKVNVDGLTIIADGLQDSFTLKAGEGMILTADDSTNEITISQNTTLSATIHKEQYNFTGGIKGSLLTSVGVASSAIIDDKIYIMGGYTGSVATNAFQCFNITNNTTTSLGTIPSIRHSAMSFAYNGNIYMAGGYTGTVSLKEFWMYDVPTASWIAKPPLNVARHNSFCTLIGTKYWVIGGTTNATRIGSVEYYDFELEQWISLDSSYNMTTARSSGSTFLFGNSIYCAGGYDATTYSLKHEVFNTETLVWSGKTDLTISRYGGTSLSYNGLGYVFAGRQTTTYTKTLYVYNPLSDKWLLKENMTNIRAFACVERYGNTFYVLGGQTTSTTNMNITEAYSTASSIVNNYATVSMIAPTTGTLLNTNTAESSRNLGLDINEVWHYGAWDSSILKVIITEMQS